MPVRPRARRAREPGFRSDVHSPTTVIAGRALLSGRLQSVEIGVDDDGRIQRIAKNVPGGRRWELGERILIPAATDLHVHLREPGGPPEVETLRSGTEAAALGGVGTVADMPNTVPPVTSVDAIRDKVARTRGQLAVDLLLYAGLVPRAAVGPMAREAGAFKLFLAETTGLDSPPSADEARELLEAAASAGVAVTVHAEAASRFRPVPTLRTTADWNAHRPPEAERAAVDSLLPAPARLRLHVAHVTEAAVAGHLREVGHSFEATPHHLLLAADASGSAGNKVNPPLRSEPDRQALWRAFAAGEIPVLASDHAPHSTTAKQLPFERAPSGVPGVETMLPLMLERVRSGELELSRLLAAACDRPARWLGLPQGRIAVGHRANLLAVDFRRRSVIRADRLRTLCGWTPFEGWSAIFPERHFRDGEPIAEDGNLVGRPDGKVVRPDYAPTGIAGG